MAVFLVRVIRMIVGVFILYSSPRRAPLTRIPHAAVTEGLQSPCYRTRQAELMRTTSVRAAPAQVPSKLASRTA